MQEVAPPTPAPASVDDEGKVLLLSGLALATLWSAGSLTGRWARTPAPVPLSVAERVGRLVAGLTGLLSIAAVAHFGRLCSQGPVLSGWLLLACISCLVAGLAALTLSAVRHGVWVSSCCAALLLGGALSALAHKARVNAFSGPSVHGREVFDWVDVPEWASFENALCFAALACFIWAAAGVVGADAGLGRALGSAEVALCVEDLRVSSSSSRGDEATQGAEAHQHDIIPAGLTPLDLSSVYDALGRAQDYERLYTDAAVACALSALPAAPTQRVVEVGCGTGRQGLKLLSAGQAVRYLGLDVSSTMVALTKETLVGGGWKGWRRSADPGAGQPEAQLLAWLAGCDAPAGAAQQLADALAGPLDGRVQEGEEEGGASGQAAGSFSVLQVQGDCTLPWLGPHTADVMVACYVLDALSTTQGRALVRAAHRALSPRADAEAGGCLVLVSLTFGRTALAAGVTRAWGSVYASNPALMGGCRPLSLAGLVQTAELEDGCWRVLKHDFVTQLALTSEVLVVQAVRAPQSANEDLQDED